MQDKVLLFVLNELTLSGAERMLQSSAGLWQRAGLQPHILATGDRPGDFAETLASCGYVIHHIPFARSPHFIAALFAFHRRHASDIIHIHTERATFWHALMARLARPQAILVRTVHSAFRFQGLLRLNRRLQRWIMRRMLHVRFTAPSRSVADNEDATFGNSMPVLPNWAAPAQPFSAAWRDAARCQLAIEDGTLVITSVGNCEAVKNHRSLLQALSHLHLTQPWLYLHVGMSPEEQDEQDLARQLGIAQKTAFVGKREAADMLAATDVFVMPSMREGFGLAAIEALSMGLPCVLADVTGLKDLKMFSAAIHWCDPASPDSIAAAIHASLAGPRRFPDVATAVQAAFTSEAGVQRFVELYDRAAR
jgi:glycosyltransferase involved in cell wall biosynthesis